MGRLSGMGQDEVLYSGLGLGSMMWWWWRLAWREFCRSSSSAYRGSQYARCVAVGPVRV